MKTYKIECTGHYLLAEKLSLVEEAQFFDKLGGKFTFVRVIDAPQEMYIHNNDASWGSYNRAVPKYPKGTVLVVMSTMPVGKGMFFVHEASIVAILSENQTNAKIVDKNYIEVDEAGGVYPEDAHERPYIEIKTTDGTSSPSHGQVYFK